MYIEDSDFIRGNIPMTKEEIRIITTAKLDIKENSRMLDIGAGTGSISIQMAKMCPKGQVVAIEKNEEAIELIHKNKNKFNVDNLSIISGEALEVKDSIEPYFDGIFIGGNGGNLDEIIRCYGSKLKSNGKMVLNFITLKNLNIAFQTLESMEYAVECIQVSVNKIKGKSYMISSNNSVFIITAVKIIKDVIV